MKYVPIVKSFQMVFLPILILVFLTTVAKKKTGILVFVFCFPLINNLPYFFGIHESIPHAPTALILFMFFFFGWLFNTIWTRDRIKINSVIARPMILIAGIILVSGIITLFRHINFFPFLSERFRDLVLNVNGVTAGGAMMSTVLSLLNYLTGFLFFLILFNGIKSQKFMVNVLLVLSLSFFLSLAFSLVQIYHSSILGNTPFWDSLGRINSTYKDPNAFGAILSSFFPVLLGMAFFSRKNVLKAFFIIVMLLSFFVFPSIGSRSGMIGLALAVIVFFLFILAHLQIPLKKKAVYLVIFVLVVGILILYFLFFAQQSNLYKRIGWSLDVLSERDSFHQFFTKKLYFWDVAGKMMEAYPFTGVGLGNYIVELPNYIEQMELPFKFTDSAENYFVHIGAELGLIGVALFLWMIFIILKKAFRRSRTFSKKSREKFLYYGVLAGLVSFLANFMAHSYIGSFDTKYFFWLLVAIVFVRPLEISARPEEKARSSVSNRYLALSLVILAAGIHLWNCSRSLSINARHRAMNWDLSFGLYQQEQDIRGFDFQWTKQNAGIWEKGLSSHIVIPLRASHPDIEDFPVHVKIFQADRYFNPQNLLEEVALRDTSWVFKKYTLTGKDEDGIYLIFQTDRTWQPLESFGVPDPRWLAVSIGKIWFEYQEYIEEEKIIRSETVPNTQWEGKFKEKLWQRGISTIRFRTDRKKFVLKLNVKPVMAYDLGPFIIVRLDDRIIAKTMFNQEGWTFLAIHQEKDVGEHELSVEFINDIYDAAKDMDRNIYLGDLEILYLK